MSQPSPSGGGDRSFEPWAGLTVLDPTNLLVAAPAGLTGLVVGPVFYVWLGLELRRR